jgi:predicted DsbA family dithiol-disulfide isomerase
MSAVIRVYSDYVCPYCFFAKHILDEVAQGMSVTIEWMPFELRPAPQATLRPEGEYLQQAWRESVYPMAERLNLRIVLPRISPQPHTALAFEGYQFALDQGQGTAYTHRMFTAFFQDERNIGDLDVLTELAGWLQMDSNAFCTALEKGQYRERHRAGLRHAYEAGITAVPTFVMDGLVLRGLPSPSQLQAFLASQP